MTTTIKAALASMVLCVAVMAVAADPAPAQPAYPPMPKQFLQGVYRVKVTGLTRGGVGSAVGIDLAGRVEGKDRYLLTCAHVILGRAMKKGDKADSVIVDVEVFKDKAVHWATGTVVAIDISRDLCLLKVDMDLPVVTKVAEKDDLEVGDALLLVGFPNGTAATPSFGYLTAKCLDLLLTDNYYTDKFWQASMPVIGGDSGGAVFDPNKKMLVGIAQACLLVPTNPDAPRTSPPTGAAAPNVCYYVPVSSINDFLDEAIKVLRKK